MTEQLAEIEVHGTWYIEGKNSNGIGENREN